MMAHTRVWDLIKLFLSFIRKPHLVHLWNISNVPLFCGNCEWRGDTWDLVAIKDAIGAPKWLVHGCPNCQSEQIQIYHAVKVDGEYHLLKWVWLKHSPDHKAGEAPE